LFEDRGLILKVKNNAFKARNIFKIGILIDKSNVAIFLGILGLLCTKIDHPKTLLSF
jgi:hypothetical protein